MEKQKQVFEFTRPADCQVEFWYSDGGDMSYGDIAHIQDLLDQGYTEGGLVFGDVRGGWKLLD